MTNPKTLVIQQMVREPRVGPEDELVFEPGVNVITGRANTGKTKWLGMLDYLFGDDGQPEDAFGRDLSEKYDSIRALVTIGDESFRLERRWKQYGLKTKVLVDDEPVSAEDFSKFLLAKLAIPILSFPKGSPYAERSWTSLSWRMLLRHIYRQQRFWGDIAQKQPDSEQHACLMQFLGIAENLFSDRYGELVRVRKEIWKREGEKEAFLSILERISNELVEEKEVQVILTASSVDAAIRRLGSEIDELQQRRHAALLELRERTAEKKQSSNGDGEPQSEFDRLGETWVAFQAQKEDNLVFLTKAERRVNELLQYRASIEAELSRMERARNAGYLLADLRVTHCPVCDQPVNQARAESGRCFLCGQTVGAEATESDPEHTRLDLEMDRLKEELQEAKELIAAHSSERDERKARQRSIEEDIRRVEEQLTPVRQVASTILPPDLAVLDMETGRIEERIRQLERIKVLLEVQKEISYKIDELRNEQEILEAEVAQITSGINFEQSSDLLASGMNTYLNALQAAGTRLWTQPAVRVKLKEHNFEVTVGRDKWSTKLGGTLVLYFLLAYQYALMSLTPEGRCHYPGLTILDLPATLEDGSMVRDKENFIAEPFVQLLNEPRMKMTQAIVAGAAFEGLEGAHRIELARVWR